MYPFDRAPVYCVRKVDIAASAAALAASETLTSPTKLSVPLTELNSNDADALTTNLATELDLKHRREDATSAAHAERVPVSDSETDTDKEDNNHTRTASLRYSDLPKKNKQNVMRASDICLVPEGSLVTLC